MDLGWEEGLECEVRVDGMQLEHVSEFKYLECIFDDSSTNEEECHRKVVGGRKIADAIRTLVIARGLQFECARVLHETFLIPVFMYSSETMMWKEESSRIRAI